MSEISKSLINTTYGMFKMPASMDLSKNAELNTKTNINTNPVQNTNTVTENPQKTSKKKYIIAAAIIAASAIAVGVGIKTGKFKKIFNKKDKPLSDGIRNGIQKNGDKYTPVKLPLGLPEKSSATLAQEAIDAEKAAKKAQKWAEKSAKLGAEAQTKTPLPEIIQLGAPKPKYTPAPLPIGLPEKSSATLAKETHELALKENKHTQMNLAITAFVAGILSKGFKDFKNAQSRELEKLEKFTYENKDMIKEEAPRIIAESQKHKEIYDTKTSSVIKENIELRVKHMRERIEKSTSMYYEYGTDNHVEFWKGTKYPKLLVQNFNNGTVKYTMYSKDPNKRSQSVIFEDGSPKEITVYNSVTENPFMRAAIRKSTDGRDYISQFYVYNKKTGVMTGTMIYDQNNNGNTFFSRGKEGKIKKVYNIDESNNLHAIALPNEEGNKCDRRYVYKNGMIDKAFISKTDTAPRRVYTFKDGQPEILDLYGKKVEMPVDGKKKLIDTVYTIPLK